VSAILKQKISSDAVPKVTLFFYSSECRNQINNDRSQVRVHTDDARERRMRYDIKIGTNSVSQGNKARGLHEADMGYMLQ